MGRTKASNAFQIRIGITATGNYHYVCHNGWHSLLNSRQTEISFRLLRYLVASSIYAHQSVSLKLDVYARSLYYACAHNCCGCVSGNGRQSTIQSSPIQSSPVQSSPVQSPESRFYIYPLIGESSLWANCIQGAVRRLDYSSVKARRA